MITVEVIPYKSFKERIKLTKELTKTVERKMIEIYPSYIYIQKGEYEDDRGI